MEKKPVEMLQISKEADLPTWMNMRKTYTKLDTPLHYEVSPIDSKSMQSILVNYTKFRSNIQNQLRTEGKIKRAQLQKFNEAKEFYEMIFEE